MPGGITIFVPSPRPEPEPNKPWRKTPCFLANPVSMTQMPKLLHHYRNARSLWRPEPIIHAFRQSAGARNNR
jgi:hypothetical protein